MKAQAIFFLAAADEALSDARRILTVGVTRQAARLAYYAQFHAAQAMILERASNVAKTHKGVNVQFHRLAKAEPTFDRGLAGTLSAAYHYKEIADYETGAVVVPAVEADAAIAAAEQFVAEIKRLLALH